ncbi:MAG: MFS transporter [Paracoccaceae bacterium]|nr:MFS transporter [Paracoccaceae bacterium]MDG1371390.1 MFS transporter [Paracoccaceae bacterium]
MLAVLRSSWALLLGILLLMIGNGLQGTLLGVRGNIEGFDPALLSYVISAYFIGFLGGSKMAPGLIRRVGHVRVFAAMASMISAAFILYAAAPNLIAWAFLRLMVGFCFSCVYVVAESWLNDASDNEHRGQALSLYVIVQMLGIVTAQGILSLGDPAGYGLFVLISVLVSISFAPILLSVSPAPVYQATKGMTLRELFNVSPLGFVGSFAIGAAFSALFGMSSVYGTEVGFTLDEIAIFVASIYVGGMILQYPIGWMSDRMDRRLLIVGVTATACAACLGAIAVGDSFYIGLGMAFLIGGMVNPLYSLLIAHANDYLDHEDMAAAAAGLVFVGGVGAIGGPVIVGQMMSILGAWAFYLYVLITMGSVSLYGIWRMTRRAATPVDETASYAAVSPRSSYVVVDMAQEYAVEQIVAEEEMAPDQGEIGTIVTKT